jgi:hypothetical protein
MDQLYSSSKLSPHKKRINKFKIHLKNIMIINTNEFLLINNFFYNLKKLKIEKIEELGKGAVYC